MSTVRVTLIGKPGCHLCDDAREAVAGVLASCGERGIRTEFDELDILQDRALARQHAEDIPVVQVNGKRFSIWRVDADKLMAAIEKAASRRKWSLAGESSNNRRRSGGVTGR